MSLEVRYNESQNNQNKIVLSAPNKVPIFEQWESVIAGVCQTSVTFTRRRTVLYLPSAHTNWDKQCFVFSYSTLSQWENYWAWTFLRAFCANSISNSIFEGCLQLENRSFHRCIFVHLYIYFYYHDRTNQIITD